MSADDRQQLANLRKQAAARQGDPVAARQLGFMLDGPAEAQPTRLSLLEFAARSGDPTGQFLLAEVLRHAPYHWPDSAVAGHYRRGGSGRQPLCPATPVNPENRRYTTGQAA